MYSFHILGVSTPSLSRRGDHLYRKHNTRGRSRLVTLEAGGNGTFTKGGGKGDGVIPLPIESATNMPSVLPLLLLLSLTLSRSHPLRSPVSFSGLPRAYQLIFLKCDRCGRPIHRGIHKCMRARVPTLKTDISRARTTSGTTASRRCGGEGDREGLQRGRREAVWYF